MDEYNQKSYLQGQPGLSNVGDKIPTEKETITSRLDRIEKEHSAFTQHAMAKIEKLEHLYQQLASYIGR